MEELLKTLISSTIITSAVTAAVAYYFNRKAESLKQELSRVSQLHSSDLEWKKKTTELMGQVYIHLNRTNRAFKKTNTQEVYHQYQEEEIFYSSNKKVRDLLLENGHHIPPELLQEATDLIEHYDQWLIKFQRLRIAEKNTKIPQIFVGPDGFRFPEHAEEKFKKKYEELFFSMRVL